MTDFPKVLVITGAGRGIGAAIARLAARRGAAVAVNYAVDSQSAAAVVDDIRREGGKALAIQGDVGFEADIIRLFEETETRLGAIDGLVNNAGISGGFAKVENVTAEALTRLMAVNITGSFLCAREAIKRMAKSRGGAGGVIVNMSSIAARTGSAGEWIHYAATKGAINSFTYGLAREVAADGIRVNAVAPGFIESDFHAAAGEPGRMARLAPTIPMQRAGTPEECAEAAVWLLSNACPYATGAILEIGGGR